nr:unnamed protein product [Digitaria exilis]
MASGTAGSWPPRIDDIGDGELVAAGMIRWSSGDDPDGGLAEDPGEAMTIPTEVWRRIRGSGSVENLIGGGRTRVFNIASVSGLERGLLLNGREDKRWKDVLMNI